MNPQPVDGSGDKARADLERLYGSWSGAQRLRDLRVARELERERHPYTADDLERERVRVRR